MPWRPQRDSVVLLAGVLSAGGLVFAAFGLVRAPQQAAEAALARAGGDVADAVVAEWERLLRAEPPPFDVAGELHTWDPSMAVPPDPAAMSAGAPSTELEAIGPAGSASAVLLAESQRLDLAGDAAGALDAALQAASAASAPGGQVRARLRAIQLAARAGRADIAREQWKIAQGMLSGQETIDSCSALLLCGLAAAPVLEPGDRAALGDELLDRWRDGRLALPEADGRLVLEARDPRAGTWVSPLADSLVERLTAIRPSEAIGAQRSESLAADALRRLLEGAPAAAPGRDAWTAVSAGFWMLLFARQTGEDTVAAFLTQKLAVCRGLDAALAEHGLVPEGFFVEFDFGAPSDARGAGDAGTNAGLSQLEGVVVRDRTALAGDALGFTVRHRDPAAFVTGERSRAGWTRVALLLMAAFSMLGAAFTARAMRRERELAGLRTAFIAGVSHELRTPVSSILLLIENLEAGRVEDSNAAGRYHTLIRREAQRLRRIVDDVLDVSRLERGRPIELRRDVVDLPAFAADLAEGARELVRRSGATLDVRVDALPATAALDADALRRAVLNLLDNAAKHAAGGAIELRIEAEAEGGLRIAVSDRGPGVPVGQRQRIFEPFARGAADGAGPPGAGLGLSIVRAIVRGHGGEVAVRGRDDGPGATFEISLPPAGSEET